MSIIVDMDKCPRCGEETLFRDFDSRSGDFDTFCQSCGCGYHFRFKRDEKGHLIRKEKTYHREDVMFVITDFETNKIIWKKKISDIPNLTEKIIKDFVGHQDLDFDVPAGYRNIYEETANSGCCLISSMGNVFKIVDENTIILCEAQIEEENFDGYGLIAIEVEDAEDVIYVLTKEDTKDMAIAKFNEMKTSVEGKIESITATWFNEKTNKLENLQQ